MSTESRIREKFEALKSAMNERVTRLWAGAEAEAWGYGGLAAVSRATGLAISTIQKGRNELRAGAAEATGGRVRREGGGRRRLEVANPALPALLQQLVDPATRGDPESPLRWTAKSAVNISRELAAQGIRVSDKTVAKLLRQLGYSLQATKKTVEGAQHPDRNAQFEFIAAESTRCLRDGIPFVSVDTKKKELVGNFKNAGVEWQPHGAPELVDVHDFPDQAIGKAIPYGVYDVGDDSGFVNVGTDHDTPVFAVTSIHAWWRRMGRVRYPNAKELFLTADAGGSNGYRSRVWKVELQRFADTTGLSVHVRHFPPGTSKWNKVEHRLFSFITMNWRGRPLRTYETVVNLIGNTTNSRGLVVKAVLDRRHYPIGRRVTDKALSEVQIERDAWHGDWNYTIHPRPLPA